MEWESRQSYVFHSLAPWPCPKLAALCPREYHINPAAAWYGWAGLGGFIRVACWLSPGGQPALERGWSRQATDMDKLQEWHMLVLDTFGRTGAFPVWVHGNVTATRRRCRGHSYAKATISNPEVISKCGHQIYPSKNGWAKRLLYSPKNI